MRTKNVLRNSIFSICAYGCTFLLILITRRAFVTFFSSEYLGYEGLFGNIFAILSLSDLGIGGVISYSLYKEIADDNETEIGKLMTIYKYMYLCVGVVVAAIGMTIFAFLGSLVPDNISNFRYVQMIFLMQLGTTLCTYFLSYKRTLLIAEQKEYICIQIDTIVQVISQIIRLVAIVFLKNYVLYLFTALVANIVSNVIISKKTNRLYPSLIKKAIISKDDFQKRHVFSDMGNVLLVGVADVIYASTDNIVIAATLGIGSVALFSNYMLITNGVNAVIRKALGPMQASIANLVHSDDADDIEKGSKLFYGLNMIAFFIAAYVATSLFVIFQPFIDLWLDNTFLLPISFVMMLCLNSYIAWAGQVSYWFRTAFGQYNEDRTAMILAAVLNLGLSIMLAPYWGLTGIIFGTIIGHLSFQYARMRFVFVHYLKKPYGGFLLRQLFLFLLTAAEAMLTMYLTRTLPVSIFGITARIIICAIVPNVINLILFYRTKEFDTIKFYLRQSVTVLLGALKRKKEIKY